MKRHTPRLITPGDLFFVGQHPPPDASLDELNHVMFRPRQTVWTSLDPNDTSQNGSLRTGDACFVIALAHAFTKNRPEGDDYAFILVSDSDIMGWAWIPSPPHFWSYHE